MMAACASELNCIIKKDREIEKAETQPKRRREMEDKHYDEERVRHHIDVGKAFQQ